MANRTPIRDLLIIGGASDIAVETVCALQFAPERITLVDRDEQGLDIAAARLVHGGSVVDPHVRDLGDETDVQAVESLIATPPAGRWSMVFLAQGVLGSRVPLGSSPDDVTNIFRINAEATTRLALAAMRSLARDGGHLVIVTSTAQLKPRRTNAVYSASKAAADVVARSLLAEGRTLGVDVTIVRPGFVRTTMTAGLDEPPMTIDATHAGADIARGIEAHKAVVWTPGRIRYAMWATQLVPDRLWFHIEPRLGRTPRT